MKNRPSPLIRALSDETLDTRIEILKYIRKYHSISEAARRANISYKAAWQAVETLGNLAGQPLLEKRAGGSGGGGAQLTPMGTQLLVAAEAMQDMQNTLLKRFELPATEAKAAPLLGLGIRTSMRNQLPCVVTSLERGEGSVRVLLKLANTHVIASRITEESVQLLGLKPGVRALALFKAMAVKILTKRPPSSTYNQLTGRVTRVARAPRAREVTLQLSEGLHLVGFHEARAKLARHQEVYSTFDESSVVLALLT